MKKYVSEGITGDQRKKYKYFFQVFYSFLSFKRQTPNILSSVTHSNLSHLLSNHTWKKSENKITFHKYENSQQNMWIK